MRCLGSSGGRVSHRVCKGQAADWASVARPRGIPGILHAVSSNGGHDDVHLLRCGLRAPLDRRQSIEEAAVSVPHLGWSVRDGILGDLASRDAQESGSSRHFRGWHDVSNTQAAHCIPWRAYWTLQRHPPWVDQRLPPEWHCGSRHDLRTAQDHGAWASIGRDGLHPRAIGNSLGVVGLVHLHAYSVPCVWRYRLCELAAQGQLQATLA
mmetsp:Transcript_2237/g.4537  ORF Transcript_2237/g.4537 Transcript_2237/m.4537 type:complete len:209 (-) Transcript_2237:30-656(-)